MNYSTYRASLDIHASGSQAVLHAKKGETKRRILITLTERGKPYLISSDCTAVFTATKPDGNIIYNDCAIDNNIICYNFTEQTTAAEGKLDCEIRLYGADNALIISPGFDLIVDAAVYEDGDVIESGTEVSALTALVSEANTLISTVNTKLENGEFNGPEGEAGGWYTPEIRQPIKKSMVVNFIPSKEGMPAAEPKLILLPEGEPGGWYTPAITQPDANTMRVAFTPSKEDMPAIEPADIAIPTGGGSGTSGEDGGYYTPEVTQTSENTMQVAFTPSKTSMPAVSGKEITLPAGQKGDKGDTGNAGADGKSAYAYAVEGGYTGTEAEFAAKLAQEKYANPEALTFTGAATGSYDGSQPLTVNIPSGGGGDNPWRLIKTVTLKETVKSITVDTDSDGNAFSLSEIYINTNVTNSEDQTVATSFSLKINGKNTNSIGTTAGLYVQCGKTGETGRNWLWLMSLNPLRALHGIWMASNTASGKTVQCYQPNEFGDTNPNPHSVGEKITSITIEGMASTAYMSAGSEFRIYGR